MKTRIFTLLVLTITCVCISYAQNASGEIKSVANGTSTDTISCSTARELAIAGNTSNVTIKGYVSCIAVEWNSTYKNISFWLADDQNGDQVLQAYRVSCAHEADAPSAGDLVWVKGNLQYYNNTTPEIGSGGSFGIVKKFGHFLIDGLYYNLNKNNNTAEVTYKSCSCYGSSYNKSWNITNAIIPATITYDGIIYDVTSIGDYAFYGCSGLTSVTIPNSVTNIGIEAFYFCTSLTSATLPNSITDIGNYAFTACSVLTSIDIPNSVSCIGKGAFKNCIGLTSVTIGNSVTSIGQSVFSGCTGLTSVSIPNSVTSFASSAFYGCTGLTSVTIDTDSICSKNYSSESSICAIFGNQVKEYIIGNNVTSIGSYAFSGCTSLTSLTLPNSVISIGNHAFSNCYRLTSVIIPNNVTSIEEGTFYCCFSLTSLTIPNDVTSIGDSAFYVCKGLTSVTIPNKVTSIGNSAFYGCEGLTSVTIPNNVTSIRDRTFYGCSGLTSLTIPNNVTSIGTYAFFVCSGLTSVTIPNSVTSIGNNAFSGCSGLTSVTIPNSVTSIGNYAFYNCSGLTSLTIGNNVTSIGQSSFSGCSGLTSVSIPNSVTNIENYAFSSCTGLSTVILEAETPPVLGEYSPFENCTSLSKIIVPCNTLAAYKYQWSTYSNILQHKPIEIRTTEGGFVTSELLCDPIEAIPYYGYHFVQWSDGNTENPRIFVVTPDTTITAEFAIDKSGTCGENLSLNWAYEDSMKTLTISGSGALTENYTFGLEAPTQMEHLVIGNEVTAIGDSAFYGKTTIAQVTIGGNVTSIGNYAFANIDNRQLTSIVMPAELTNIGDYAFSGNTYLESIDFNAKLLSIGAYAFKDCRRVSEMTCMAETTPDVGTNALSSINSYASLCVPASCVRKYQVDPNWGRFDLCELGATTSTGSVTTVTVEPSDNTALFTWPTENDAATYTLQITKDGEVFCTLVFNANGQLTGIAFAPSRTGTPHAPAATLANGAMQFTVTGLNVANKYAYRLAVTDASNVELQSYSGEFATNGYEGEVNPGGDPESGHEDVDQLYQDPALNVQKLLHNGQILILRGDRTYTVTGQEIK